MCRSSRLARRPVREAAGTDSRHERDLPQGLVGRQGDPRRCCSHTAVATAAGTGLGKPLKFLDRVARCHIPIVIVSIRPSNVEMTAQIADGWQPIHFVPGRFDRVWGAALAAGRSKRSADLEPLSLFGDAQLAIGEGRGVADARGAARNTIGFYAGGIGARSKNYYNDLFRRYGWENEAAQIQDLFLGGKRAEAMAAVRVEYIDTADLIGPEEHVKGRLGVWRTSASPTSSSTPRGRDHSTTSPPS